MKVPRSNEREAGGCAGLDQAQKRIRIRVFFDQVAEPVELLLAQRAERRVRGRHEAPPRGGRDLAQEGPPERVALQRPVPVRAPHSADAATVQKLSPPRTSATP